RGNGRIPTLDRRVFNKQPWVRKGFQTFKDLYSPVYRRWPMPFKVKSSSAIPTSCFPQVAQMRLPASNNKLRDTVKVKGGPGLRRLNRRDESGDRQEKLSDARCGTKETGGRTEDPRDKAEQDPPTNLSCAAEEGVALGSCVADGRRLPGGRECGRTARLLERAALRVGCPRKSQVSSRSIVLTTNRMGTESKATFAYKQRHLHIIFISHHSSLLGAYSEHVCTANALESERSRCGVMDRALSMGT
ncbi:unnamed protein product, partial [Notodromas monacha]